MECYRHLPTSPLDMGLVGVISFGVVLHHDQDLYNSFLVLRFVGQGLLTDIVLPISTDSTHHNQLWLQSNASAPKEAPVCVIWHCQDHVPSNYRFLRAISWRRALLVVNGLHYNLGFLLEMGVVPAV